MPLRVVGLVQQPPVTPGGVPVSRPAFARSQAYEILTRELRRYLTSEIHGRSFLISGHRGSGKTNLVLRAVEDLAEGLEVEGGWIQRPLLVKLHGPSLIPRSVVAEAANPESSSGEEHLKNGGKPPGMIPAQRVLIQITIALYRALSGEVAHRFRARARALAAEGPRNDAIELAAQLQLELDNAPSPATLRAFWERIGALQRGVLWLSAPSANFDRFGYLKWTPE